MRSRGWLRAAWRCSTESTLGEPVEQAAALLATLGAGPGAGGGWCVSHRSARGGRTVISTSIPKRATDTRRRRAASTATRGTSRSTRTRRSSRPRRDAPATSGDASARGGAAQRRARTGEQARDAAPCSARRRSSTRGRSTATRPTARPTWSRNSKRPASTPTSGVRSHRAHEGKFSRTLPHRPRAHCAVAMSRSTVRSKLVWSKQGSGEARFGCPHFCSDCLFVPSARERGGRTVYVHPRHRGYWTDLADDGATPWKKRFRATRPKVERSIAPLMRRNVEAGAHGARLVPRRARLRLAGRPRSNLAWPRPGSASPAAANMNWRGRRGAPGGASGEG